MASPAETSSANLLQPPILFRTNKKRKTGLRQRAAPSDDTADLKSTTSDSKPLPITETRDESSRSSFARKNDPEETQHIPSTIRHRARKRLNGVAFSTARTSTISDDPSSTETMSLSSSRALIPALSTSLPDDDPLIAKRFAPQTGLATTIVNKHMMEYIESHLSNRVSALAEVSPDATCSQSGAVSYNTATSAAAAAVSATATAPAPRNELRVHPIMQGKLMEVDLGDEVRARNQAMTERAARRLLGEAVPEDDTEDSGREAKKPRLGRDGKPWRPRKRRGSDDIKRDQLVEEILHENKLDVYDVPATQPPQYEGEGNADDRIAEQFRREFIDAMVQRRRQKKKKSAAPSTRAGTRKADVDFLKGPKLGGSRNSRAAVRDLLLKKAKEGKK